MYKFPKTVNILEYMSREWFWFWISCRLFFFNYKNDESQNTDKIVWGNYEQPKTLTYDYINCYSSYYTLNLNNRAK